MAQPEQKVKVEVDGRKLKELADSFRELQNQKEVLINMVTDYADTIARYNIEFRQEDKTDDGFREVVLHVPHDDWSRLKEASLNIFTQYEAMCSRIRETNRYKHFIRLLNQKLGSQMPEFDDLVAEAGEVPIDDAEVEAMAKAIAEGKSWKEYKEGLSDD